MSSAAEDLMRGFCCRDVERRLLAGDALEHPWFRSQWPSPLKHLNTLMMTKEGDLGLDEHCCDFAELVCGHSHRCQKREHHVLAGESEKLHFAGALTHLRKLGLQHPEEASQLADRLIEKWKHYATLTPLKRAVLAFAAQQLEHVRELSYIRAIFDLLDTKGDGVLTREELRVSLAMLRTPGRCEVPMSASPGPYVEDDIEELLNYVDLNCNGKIEYSEFAAACLDNSTYRKPAASKAVFGMLDRDGDGRIGSGELKRAFGWSEDHDLVDQIFEDADIDKDGFIGAEDFDVLLEDSEIRPKLYDAGDSSFTQNQFFDEVLGRKSKDCFDFSKIAKKINDNQDPGFSPEALDEIRKVQLEHSKLQVQRSLRDQYAT